MKVSELIEALSRYDRDDDVTFYYLKNNTLINCQFEDLGFYGDMGVEFTIQDTYDGIETKMLQPIKCNPIEYSIIMKEFTSTVTLTFEINNLSAFDKEEYIERLKEQYIELYDLEIKDHEITNIEEYTLEATE